MFTWICPKCGSEVPPSYSECPNCAGGAQPPAPETAPQPAPQPAPPAVYATPSAPVAQAPPAASSAIAKHRRVPGWVLTLLVVVALLSLGVSLYLVTRPSKPAGQAPEKTTAAAPAGKRHPLWKHIEVTGIRITEDAAQKAQVQFLVVNHSGADIADLGGTLTLKPKGAKPGNAPLASFEFKVPSIGPYESKELKNTVHSNLRAYELPDWQFLETEIEITSPVVEQ
jgi:hypothetical protein